MELLDGILVALLVVGALYFLIKKSTNSESCGTGCGCKKDHSHKEDSLK